MMSFDSVEEEEKAAILREETNAYDTPLDARIHTAKLSSEGLAERDQELTDIASGHRDDFTSYEDAIFFAMLPLSVSDRAFVLKRARVLEAAKKGSTVGSTD
jgi:hypothetical protein